MQVVTEDSRKGKGKKETEENGAKAPRSNKKKNTSRNLIQRIPTLKSKKRPNAQEHPEESI